MGVDADLFKAALGRFASGVTAITVHNDGDDHGMTASAFCSLSIDPPLVLVCVKKGNHTHGLMEETGAYVINLLDQEQVSVSNRFAGWWEEGKSKWEDLELSRGSASGAVMIGGSLASLDCTLHSVLDGGDHSIFVGEVQDAVINGEDRDALKPLLYFAGSYRTTGPKI
jgi:flavin reductase (DIM6/NTAB) family NADH-FMN oxidoreductase RutF